MVQNSPYGARLQDRLAALKVPPFKDLEDVRSRSPAGTADAFLAAFPDFTHTEYSVPSDQPGADHTIHLSVLKSNKLSRIPRPVVYSIHGGGQTGGNRFVGFEIVMKSSCAIDPVLISVEYRRPPEYPPPAALQDTYAGLVWIAKNAVELNIDPEKIMILGISGGGAMAAGCALLARKHQYPPLFAQMLLTPMLDDRDQTVSAKQYSNHGPWSGNENRMAWDLVLGKERGGPNVSEFVAPSRATDLSGLPQTYLDAGESEGFRDETVAYASLSGRVVSRLSSIYGKEPSTGSNSFFETKLWWRTL